MKGVYNHACELCGLCDVGNNWVCLPGRGDSTSRGLIVGEAPGATEDEEGRPFVGLSGRYVDSALTKAGVRPDAVYITNAVKCRPPANRTPTEGELLACFGYLHEEVSRLNPVAIMTLGNPAMFSVLRDKGGITKKAGLWRRIEGVSNDLLVIPNLHPAYIARYPEKQSFFEEVVDDFVKVWQYGEKHSTDETWRYAKP